MRPVSVAEGQGITRRHHVSCSGSLLLALALACTWGPATARADAFDDHVQQGQLLVIQQKLSEAAKEFEAAYKLKKQPDVALQLGRVYLKLKRGAAAQHYCALYLAEEFDAPPDRKQKATECLEQAKLLTPGKKGSLGPTQPLPGTSSKGAAPAQTPLSPTISVAAEIASSPQVSARAADWSPIPETLDVPKEDPPPPPPIAVVPTPMVTSHREGPQPVYKKWWFWTLVGVGAAGAAAGVAIGVSQSTLTSAPTLDPLEGIPMGDRRQIAF